MSLFGTPSQPSTGGGFTFGTPSSIGTGFGAFGTSQNTPNKLFGTTSFGTSFGAATTTASCPGSVFGFGAKTTASSSFGMNINYVNINVCLFVY